MTCVSSEGASCQACMGVLYRPLRIAETPASVTSGCHGSSRDSNSTCPNAEPMAGRIISCSLTAFLMPLVACIAIVQAVESRLGSVAGAALGVLGGGFAATVSGKVLRCVVRTSSPGFER